MNENSTTIANTDTPWIFTSGLRGMKKCEIPLIGEGQKPESYTVKLYFAAPENDKPGQRVFDVKLQDQTVLKNFDIVVATGAAKKAHIAEFPNTAVSDKLTIGLIPQQADADAEHQPILCGIEVLRANAKEIRERVVAR